MSNNENFMGTLRDLMDDNHVSIRKLAKLSGIAPATIQRLRTGESLPQAETIRKLSEALGVDEQILFFASGRDAVDLDIKYEAEYNKHIEDVRRNAPVTEGTIDTEKQFIPNADSVPVLKLSQIVKYLNKGLTENEIDDIVNMPPITLNIPSGPSPDFAVVAETAAMAPAVSDGDILYFSRNGPRLKSGQIVVAELENNSVTIGRFKRDLFDMFLSFDNNSDFSIPDIKIKNVLGICVGLYRPFF